MLLLSVFFILSSIALFGCNKTQENYENLLSNLEISKSNIDNDLNKIEKLIVEIQDDYEDVSIIKVEFQAIKSAYDQTGGLNLEASTSEMLSLYSALVNAKNGSGYWNLDNLIEETGELLLFGRWTNQTNYIGLQRVYTDYNNTKYSDWFSYNMPNSKQSNREYYYYIEYINDKLVIGFKDKITEVKTDNYEITYTNSGMILNNLIENKVYNMTLDTTYQKEIKGNAKMAYEYIASIIRQYTNPQSVVILRCEVKNEMVYIYSEASNQVGGKVQNYYVIMKVGNNYYINETSLFTNNNIDLEELNTRLQSFLK